MNPITLSYAALFVAIILEVIATSALQASQQFTKPVPTAIMVVGYLSAFYALTWVLRVMPVGIAYAIWSGLGIVLITAVGFFVFKQKLDMPALLGVGLIVMGVVVINVFSKTTAHP